jgi:hypothetical protein
MTHKRAWILGGVAVTVIACATVCAVVYALYFSDWPGGMRPSYRASDYDSRLTAEAKSAIPIAKAIKAYFAAHGNYPSNTTQLQVDLPTSHFSPEDDCGGVDGWTYYTGPGVTGFTLSRKLGWDPSLQYSWDGTAETWVFDPGDGSPRKLVALRP